MNHLSIRALEEFPLINPGDNLSSIILDSIEDNDITIDDGDVILLAQKIISKSENRFKNFYQKLTLQKKL
jgi:coenzyme F420-0:L-glutamate ligase/coenzyme F420-1:gamma-L-glutamate ligase